MSNSLFLNKISESLENDWMDDEGRIYIIYPIEEIMADLKNSKFIFQVPLTNIAYVPIIYLGGVKGMEKIFTLLEAREFLKVSDATIRRYIKGGKLRSQKLGREYRITESALQEFVDEQAKKGGIPSV